MTVPADIAGALAEILFGWEPSAQARASAAALFRARGADTEALTRCAARWLERPRLGAAPEAWQAAVDGRPRREDPTRPEWIVYRLRSRTGIERRLELLRRAPGEVLAAARAGDQGAREELVDAISALRSADGLAEELRDYFAEVVVLWARKIRAARTERAARAARADLLVALGLAPSCGGRPRVRLLNPDRFVRLQLYEAQLAAEQVRAKFRREATKALGSAAERRLSSASRSSPAELALVALSGLLGEPEQALDARLRVERGSLRRLQQQAPPAKN